MHGKILLFLCRTIIITYLCRESKLHNMKRLFTLLAVVSMFGSCCLAQQPRFRIQKNEEKRLALTLDNMKIEVDANNGARIVSLKIDNNEILSQSPMPNTYGSTFWTSPQKEWNWPPVHEHDMAAYDVTLNMNPEYTLEMTSPLSERFPLRIKKRFATDDKDKCFIITYTIINESNEPRKVAPWEITRVPAQGRITFEADAKNITAGNNMGIIPFTQAENLVYYDIDHVDGQNRKINSDGTGWLAYANNGIILRKVFPDLKPSEPAPGEAEIQVYVNQGNTYVEIESQGAYVELQPHASVTYTVKWYVEYARK